MAATAASATSVGPVGVGKALTEVDGAGPDGEGRHLGEDRGRERLQAAGEDPFRHGPQAAGASWPRTAPSGCSAVWTLT